VQFQNHAGIMREKRTEIKLSPPALPESKPPTGKETRSFFRKPKAGQQTLAAIEQKRGTEEQTDKAILNGHSLIKATGICTFWKSFFKH